MRHGKSDLWILLALLFVASVLFLPVLFHEPRIPAIHVKQKAQLHSLDAAIELFKNEMNAYPPSDANDPAGKPYCGAMKLTEALMGWDSLGFHSESVFRCDGLNPDTLAQLYPVNPPSDNVSARWGPYLAAETANMWRMADIYGEGDTGPFPKDAVVLCDVFERRRPSGKETGMPILYYRAHRSGSTHEPGNPLNIYDCTDNRDLIALGVPGKSGKTHPLLDPQRFYLNTQNDRSSTPEPWQCDSYILISAGKDGLYGTADDIYNFPWKYREQ